MAVSVQSVVMICICIKFLFVHVLGPTATLTTIGTLRNQDMAIGRRLMLRHLATTSYEKASRYLIPTQAMETRANQNMH